MNATMSNHASAVFLKDTMMLFLEHFAASIGYHETLCLIIGYETAFDIRIKNGEWQKSQVALINADVPFDVKTGEGLDAILFITPESVNALKLNNSLLKDGDYVLLPYDQISSFAHQLNSFNVEGCSMVGINNVFDHMVAALCGTEVELRPVHPKIVKALDFIVHNHDHDIKVDELADQVDLTEGKLNFLFRSQVGTTISAFITWTSVANVMLALIRGESLENAAEMGEFMHKTEFSALFQRIFGLHVKTVYDNEVFHSGNICFLD